ncbi:MAG: class II aldolase/adducin family protein [Syntrophobacterales bacterium]|nr:class II aldolase/adducin family protein [Syntrophobacterales bacterium]
MNTGQKLKQKVVRICRLLHQKNLIAATDGNISVKFGDGLLTTPSGVNKAFLEEDQIITVDFAGRVIEGQGQPTSELAMHLAVYRLRPEVEAVIHAHPPLATAFSLAGASLEQFVLPEVVLSLGVIPTAAYATPTTAEVPLAIRELIKHYDALILERHGALTVGRDLIEAYNKMEKLEHTALIIFAALQLGGVKNLPAHEVEKLLQMRFSQKLQSS